MEYREILITDGAIQHKTMFSFNILIGKLSDVPRFNETKTHAKLRKRYLELLLQQQVQVSVGT